MIPLALALVALTAAPPGIEGLGLGPVAAQVQQGSWWYACPNSGGLVVVDLAVPGQPKLVGRQLEGRFCTRLVLDGQSLIVLESREEAVTLSLLDPAQPSRAVAVVASSAEPAPAAPPVAAVVPRARVVEVKGGRVVFDGGAGAGFAPGMRVRVLSQRLVAKPDLLTGGSVQAPSGEMSAVLVIEQAEADRAMAILGRGDLAEPGDVIEPTDLPTSERLLFPRRAPFSWRTGFTVRPFLGLEGTSKPVGFIVDGFVAWYPHAVPLAIEVGVAPMAFAVNTREAHYPGTFTFTLAYVTDYFEIGLGAGALIGNLGPCYQSGPLDAPVCEANTGVTINQRLRLGALDGFHFEWQSSVFSRPDRFVFGVGRGEVAVPLTSRLGLFGAGGAGENGWGMGELGVRTWMSGTGAPGTLILSASLGYSAIFDGPSRDFVGGPAVGFGMEWRL